MKHLDEYQRMKRYKLGYHTLILIVVLQAVNYFLNIDWAEDPRFESVVILLIAGLYFTVTAVYSGAFFAKWENPFFASFFHILSGTLMLLSTNVSQTPLVENGQITWQAINILGALHLFSIPLTYLVRMTVDKRRDVKEDKIEIK